MNLLDIFSMKPMVKLGGEFVHLERVTGDIVSQFKWIDDEPVMILFRAVPKTKTGAYVINLRDAYKYGARDGHPTPWLIKDAMECAEAIGFHMDKDAAKRCVDIIIDGLPDLLMMPPTPPAQTEQERPVTLGDALSVSLNGKQIIETEI